MNIDKKMKICIITICILGLTGCNKTININLNKEEINVANEENVSNNSTDPFENLFSFYFKVDEYNLHMNMTLQELIDDGWLCSVYGNDRVKGDIVLTEVEFIKADSKFMGNLLNPSDYYNTANNCYLSKVIFDQTTSKITLPKDIILNTSKKEEVIKKYGEPNSEIPVDNKEQTIYIYEYDKNETITLTIDDETGIVIDINLNYVKEKDKLMVIPEAISTYQRANTLHGSFDIGEFSLDGIVYKTPIPVTHFLENGWQVIEENIPIPPDNQLESAESIHLAISKNDLILPVTIKNYSTDKKNINDSHVTQIEFNSISPEILTISPNMPANGSKEQLLSIIGTYEYEYNEAAEVDTYQIYFNDTSSALVYIDRTTNQITYFELSNFPK